MITTVVWVVVTLVWVFVVVKPMYRLFRPDIRLPPTEDMIGFLANMMFLGLIPTLVIASTLWIAGYIFLVALREAMPIIGTPVYAYVTAIPEKTLFPYVLGITYFSFVTVNTVMFIGNDKVEN